MVGGRRAATRLLLVLLVASVLLPAVLLAFAAWTSHRSIARDTDERIDRSLDILHEHALKVIQTVERTFGEIDEITRGLSDLDIRLNERSLHERLARIVRDLPQLRGIALIPVPTSAACSSRA